MSTGGPAKARTLVRGDESVHDVPELVEKCNDIIVPQQGRLAVGGGSWQICQHAIDWIPPLRGDPPYILTKSAKNNK